MLRTNDLKIEEEILPIFDYTYSESGAAYLRLLMTTIPHGLEAIYERQAILKAILAHWKVIGSFSLQRLDYNEVKEFLEAVASRRLLLQTSMYKAYFKSSISDTEQQKLRSKQIQFILFFNRLQTNYFSKLVPADFPPAFGKHLEQIQQFMGKFDLEQLAQLVKEHRLKISHSVLLNQKLVTLPEQEVAYVWQSLAVFEAYFSVAKAILANQFVFPTLGASDFVLQSFHHPLLKSPVKNTLELAAGDNVVLLTGPNMAGKSTLFRAVGICVYLAHVGFAVPADKCVLPFFEVLSVSLNAADSLQNGYSHFSAEVINLKAVAQRAKAGESCFAIFDELFKGTNTDDALDITQAVIRGLARHQHSLFFISTHLLQLKETTDVTGVKKYNIACQLEDGVPQFTFKLQEGWSDLKLGRIIFDLEGLPAILAS